jgi:arylsulfatase A-like enzyme
MQGHCCGVDPKHNEDNTYYEAISNKSALISEILSIVDDNTIVFITSDHGHVDRQFFYIFIMMKYNFFFFRGGHGGINDVLRDVPLIVYQKNSDFRTMKLSENFPRFREENSRVSNLGEKNSWYIF